MASKLFGWFAPKRGDRVLEMVEEHLALTQDAVSDLYRLVEASALKRESDTKELFESLSQLEMRADQLRRDMIVKLTERDVFPSEREDLMDLVRAVDWVADWAREAGRILVIIPFEDAPDEMKEAVQAMTKECVACVTVLVECIQELPLDRMRAIELADQVEMFEEDIDDLYSDARALLSKLEFPTFSRGSLILMNEFLDAIETVADWCENTVDIVRAIAVRGQ